MCILLLGKKLLKFNLIHNLPSIYSLLYQNQDPVPVMHKVKPKWIVLFEASLSIMIDLSVSFSPLIFIFILEETKKWSLGQV